MGIMEIEAIAPKAKLCVPAKGHKVYPYLLCRVELGIEQHCRYRDVFASFGERALERTTA